MISLKNNISWPIGLPHRKHWIYAPEQIRRFDEKIPPIYAFCEVRGLYKHAFLSPTDVPRHSRSVKSIFIEKSVLDFAQI